MVQGLLQLTTPCKNESARLLAPASFSPYAQSIYHFSPPICTIIHKEEMPSKSLYFLTGPDHSSSKAIIPEGITHCTLKMLKIKLQNSLAAGQRRRRWAIDSPLLLHMQHQSNTWFLLLRRLSIVNTDFCYFIHSHIDYFFFFPIFGWKFHQLL